MRRRFTSLGILSMFLMGSLAYAQVKGVLKDSNGFPMDEVEVIVTRTGASVFTDVEGNFNVDAKVGVILKIIDSNGEEKTIKVTSTTLGDVKFITKASSSIELNTVTLVGGIKMDAAQKIGAYDIVKKEDFDKVMSEASSYKKQLKEKMTAEETAAAEAKAAQEKLQNDYNALLKENTISKNVAKYIALGYDEKLAKSTAEALFDGDMETVFANAAKANQLLADKLKADLMRNSPRPSGAGTSTEEESEYMAFAKRSGKAKAQANEAAAKVMDYYK